MTGPEFFQTQMGHIFYESTMPRIAKALETVAKRLTEQAETPPFSDPLDDPDSMTDKQRITYLEEQLRIIDKVENDARRELAELIASKNGICPASWREIINAVRNRFSDF